MNFFQQIKNADILISINFIDFPSFFKCLVRVCILSSSSALRLVDFQPELSLFIREQIGLWRQKLSSQKILSLVNFQAK